MRSNLQRVARIWRVQAWVCALLWIAAIADIVYWGVRGWGYPLIRYFDAFQDLVIYQSRFTYLHTPTFFNPHILHSRFEWPPSAFAYPPAAIFAYGAFYLTSQPEAVYTVCMAAWCGLCAYTVYRTLGPVRQGIVPRSVITASLLLFSFPAVFLAERANLELFVWMLIATGIVLYKRQSCYTAAILFGLAVSLKLYPVVFLGLFFKDGFRWRYLLTALAATLTVSLLAVWYVGPGFLFALHGFGGNLVRFTSEHAQSARLMEAPFDHSLFAAIKAFYLFSDASPARWALPYYVVAGSAAALLFFLRVRTLPLLNRLTFLTVVMITLPPASYEYTIVHLYLPLLGLSLLLCSTFKKIRATPLPTSAIFAFGCMLLTMTPVGIVANGRFPYAGLLQLAALLGVAAASVVEPWSTHPGTLE